MKAIDVKKLRVKPGKKFDLKKWDTKYTGKELTKKEILSVTNISVIRYKELLHFSIVPRERVTQ